MPRKAMKLWDGFQESDTFSHERSLWNQGYARVAGTDEVGRGPLAGPVVAASVILPRDCHYGKFRDSKTLSARARTELFLELKDMGAVIGIGLVSAPEIDRLNILQASLLAMKIAVLNLAVEPDFLLVDGKFSVPLPVSQQTLVKGDSRSATVAAASIVAKVHRDRLMEELHGLYPVYNFKAHKGYATAEHRRMIKEYGPCEIHRQSYRPVQESLRREAGEAGPPQPRKAW